MPTHNYQLRLRVEHRDMQIQVSTNREIHCGVVPSLSWCGQELITIGDDGSIHRWDGIKSGRPISPASLAAKKTQVRTRRVSECLNTISCSHS